MESLTSHGQTMATGQAAVKVPGTMSQQTTMSPLSVPSLILGFHVMQGVLAGIKVMPPQDKQTTRATTTKTTTTMAPPPTLSHVETTRDDTHFPLPTHFLDRRPLLKRLYPKKRNLKPHRLMKKMGKDFDSFWMSASIPKDFLHIKTKPNIQTSLYSQTSSLDLPSIAHKMVDILESSVHHRNNSTNVTSGLDLDDSARVMTGVMNSLQSWLVQVGSCPVYYKWEDMGPLFWPRFVRTGMCSRRGGVENNPLDPSFDSPPPPLPHCSWPPGMRCTPGKEKLIRLLRWNCKHTRAPTFSNKFRHTGKKKSSRTTPYSLLDHSQREYLRRVMGEDRRAEADDDEDDEDDSEELFSEMEAGVDPSFSLRKFLLEKTSVIHEDNKPSQEKGGLQSRSSDATTAFKENRYRKMLEEKSRRVTPRATGTGTTRRRHLPVTSTTTRHSQKPGGRVRREASHRHRGHQGKGKRKGRRRKSHMKCRWSKLEFPVVDDCHCSC